MRSSGVAGVRLRAPENAVGFEVMAGGVTLRRFTGVVGGTEIRARIGHEEIVRGDGRGQAGQGRELGAEAQGRYFDSLVEVGGSEDGCFHGGVAPAPEPTPTRPKKSPSGVAPEGQKSF